MKQIHEIVRIAAAGGGFKMNASLKSIDDLVRIASATSNNGAKIIFTGLTMKTTDEIVRISAAGRGNIFFEDE